MSQPPGYPPVPGDPQHEPPVPPTMPAAGGSDGPGRAPAAGSDSVGQAQPGQPGYYPGPPQPGGYPGPAYPYGEYPPPAGPSRRRALIITSIVLGVVLLLCGGGGTTAYFLITRVGNSGRPTPAAAVDGFLNAVLREHDADKANKFVCSESRDKAALNRKISELQSYEEKYKSLRYSWA